MPTNLESPPFLGLALCALSLGVVSGCALSSEPGGDPDFVEVQGCVVLDDPAAEPDPCMAHEVWGCSNSEYQWFWDGADCSVMLECQGMGAETRIECLQAHQSCAPVDVCSAVVMIADEPAGCGPCVNILWDGTSCTDYGCCDGPECAAVTFESIDQCLDAYAVCAPSS